MHELSIATSLLESVHKEAGAHPEVRIKHVGIRIGELAGVDTDALLFGWEAIVKGTQDEHLSLKIEQIPWRNRCTACKTEFRVVDYQTECPGCGSPGTRLVGGDELELAYLEVEDDAQAEQVRSGGLQ